MSPGNVPLPALLGGMTSAIVGSMFAGADTALTSLTSSRLSALIEQSTGTARETYVWIQEQDAKLRSRYLLGRVACTCLAAVFFYRASEPLGGAIAPYLAFAVTVVLTALLFEVSTTIARKYADSAAPIVVRYLRPFEIALLPLAIPLGWLGGRLAVTRAGEAPPADPRVTEAEVEILVDEGEKSGLFGREPAEMIRNVLEFADRTARDVMIPREKVEAIEISTPMAEVLRIVTEGSHSRYPVYRGRLDEVVGLVYAKDLFKALEDDEAKKKKLNELLRPANFVAGSRPLATLLREMRRLRQHLAIVVDELGGVAGIITLEDVLEEIVGDIRDEHDEKPIEDLGNGRVVADANMSFSDLGTYLGKPIEDHGDYESIGEMITEHLGKIPEAGAALTKFGLRFVVRDADENHIGKVEIERLAGPPLSTRPPLASDSR